MPNRAPKSLTSLPVRESKAIALPGMKNNLARPLVPVCVEDRHAEHEPVRHLTEEVPLFDVRSHCAAGYTTHLLDAAR